jgi:hypothetical protein
MKKLIGQNEELLSPLGLLVFGVVFGCLVLFGVVVVIYNLITTWPK